MRSRHLDNFWYGFSAVAALTLVIASVAVSMRLLPQQHDETPTTTSSPGRVTSATPLPVSAQAARELVMQLTPGSVVTHVELGVLRGSLVYEVYLDTGDCYTVNAATGEVAQVSTGSKPAGVPPAVPGTSDAQRAGQLAKAKYPGSEVRRVELGTWRGALVYKVELDNGQTVFITASDLSVGVVATATGELPQGAGQEQAPPAIDNRADGSDAGRRDALMPTPAPTSTRAPAPTATSTPSPVPTPVPTEDRGNSGRGSGNDDRADDRDDDRDRDRDDGRDDNRDDDRDRDRDDGRDDNRDDGRGDDQDDDRDKGGDDGQDD